jgi:hypothetical protein
MQVLAGTSRVVDEATRAVVAKIVLFPDFAARCVRLLAQSPFRAVAPCAGLDLAYVLERARGAVRRAVVRDLILCGILFFSMLDSSVFWLFAPFFAFMLEIGGFVVLFAERAMINGQLRQQLGAMERGSPSALSALFESQRLQYLDAASDGNVLVHSGFDPFVAFGAHVGGWSTPISLRGASAAIDVSELLREIAHGVEFTGIPGLSVGDFVFVEGRWARTDPWIVRDPYSHPTTSVPPEFVEALFKTPRSGERAYKRFTVKRMGGQFVLTVLLRAEIIDENVYVEAEYRLLTPVDALDVAARHLGGDVRSMLADRFRIARSVPIVTATAPLRIFENVVEFFFKSFDAAHDRANVANRYYDYGALGSVRQLAGEQDGDRVRYRSYLEYLDKEMCVKIIGPRIFGQLIKAMDARGIDTTALLETRQIIQNTSVVLTGNTITGENVVIGNSGQNVVTSIKNALGSMTKGVVA